MRKIKITIFLAIILVVVILGVYLYTGLNSKTVLEKFIEKEPASIVCLGDSLTYGYGADVSYEEELEWNLKDEYNYDEIEVLNKGVNGRNSLTLLNKFKSYISNETDLVILFIGANDIFHNEDLETKDNIEKIIKYLLNKNIELVICTYPYTEIERYFTDLDEEGINEYHLKISNLNDDIRELSEKYKIGLADLEKDFKYVLEEGTYEYDDIFSDGVHFNDLGYGLMAIFILEEIYDLLK